MPLPTEEHSDLPPPPPVVPAAVGRPRLGRNVVALGIVSLFTDVASEMIYPLMPLFLSTVLGASAGFVGAIEGAAESTAALLKLVSGWWSDRVRRRKPLVVIGYTIASVARPLVAFAQSAPQVLLIRLTDRVGKGIRTSPRDALIADSVHPAARGRAFGFHRSADHLGAVLGPLAAYAALEWGGLPLRTVFLLAAIPGAIAVAVLVLAVRERAGADAGGPPRVHDATHSTDSRNRSNPSGGTSSPGTVETPSIADMPMGRRFWAVLVVILLFTLGNSTDAFLLLRASDLGVPTALVPILWAMLHVVKSASSMPGGALSDRLGRKPLIVVGWLLYAGVYFAFGAATTAWHAWALFAVYGVYFGLTEGAEKALVADLVPASRRGTAYGWFNLTIGVAALPASLLFGLVWDRWGPSAAFTLGASLALAAAVGMTIVGPRAPSPVRRA